MKTWLSLFAPATLFLISIQAHAGTCSNAPFDSASEHCRTLYWKDDCILGANYADDWENHRVPRRPEYSPIGRCDRNRYCEMGVSAYYRALENTPFIGAAF